MEMNEDLFQDLLTLKRDNISAVKHYQYAAQQVESTLLQTFFEDQIAGHSDFNTQLENIINSANRWDLMDKEGDQSNAKARVTPENIKNLIGIEVKKIGLLDTILAKHQDWPADLKDVIEAQKDQRLKAIERLKKIDVEISA
ncbi:MAG: hypothetical protein AAF843_01550 [Bacteroidota bacterium]